MGLIGILYILILRFLMKTTRLTDPNDPLFDSLWRLYENSFPIFEQRTPEHQATALRSPHFHFVACQDPEQLIGLIGYWEFDDYLYIEHYAIDPALRGHGYGSDILRTLIHSTDKTIILEIDEPQDEISIRRLHFYQRLGFVSNPYVHPLPRYRNNDEHREVYLQILTYPTAIDPQQYEQFNRDLNEIVMKRD